MSNVDDPTSEWAVVEVNGYRHVIPIYDIKEHEETFCWCVPRIKVLPDTVAVIHKAGDGRDADANETVH